MELNWLIYSILGLLCLGITDFIKKYMVSRGGNADIFLLLSFCFYPPVFFLNMLLHSDVGISNPVLFSGILLGVINIFIPIGMFLSLKHLDTAFSLVSIRLISSFILLFVGVYFLSDQLTLYNIWGFILGAIAIFLLSGVRWKNNISFPIKGLFGLFLCITAIVVYNSYYKYLLPDIDLAQLMFVQFSASIIALFSYNFLCGNLKNITYDTLRKVFPYAGLVAIFISLYFLYFLPQIFLLGPLSLGYKMLSYSLAVPIILSIIFFGDPINKTRIFAFILTFLSIFLFLI
ncbi:hypothetical protein MK079_05400 [Candidatus Gracilibacteria bacterium]|nr:hypothetical protein [Candidatus Gracilibacteria bacterium]